jgi:2-polyprenyl-3-methyl-5-hydroxy-6-metoxy-1,4-benzoquinol methylase
MEGVIAFDRVPVGSSESQRVADLWSTHHGGTDAFSSLVYWLAVPEVARRFQRRATGGKAEHWINYCVSEFLTALPVERMCSIGCGTGELERHLAGFNAFRSCDAIDLAPGALDIARRAADAAGIGGIRYACADIQTMPLDERAYDAIWFNNSLHHVRDLEGVCDRVAAALRPDGVVFVNEYVGADRFDFPIHQKNAIRAAFALVPERYRRSFLNPGRAVQPAPLIPNPRDVKQADPSESVRSSEILEVLEERFDVVAHHKTGGTLLQFLLHGIAGNFRSEDPDSIAVLEMLFQIEDTLIDTGALPSDFVLVVARPR